MTSWKILFHIFFHDVMEKCFFSQFKKIPKFPMTSQEKFFHDVMEKCFFIIFEMLNKRLLNRFLGIINKFAVTTVAECHLGMFGCRILKNGEKC